jgi:hypothetical protein
MEEGSAHKSIGENSPRKFERTARMFEFGKRWDG